MSVAEVRKTAEQKMQKSIESLKTDLGKVRTGRAHTGLLDHVVVDYYGNPTPVPQIRMPRSTSPLATALPTL